MTELALEHISTRDKLKFFTGSIGYSLSSGFFAAWLSNFYIKIVKIEFIYWALAWVLYLAWNSINDPLIGYLGDRTRTRYGRRKPWLMLATPLIGASLIFIFFPPLQLDPGLGSTQVIFFFWLFSGLMLYDLFYTIIGISQNSLVAELTIDPVDRARANLFWSLGLGLGQAITFIFPFLFIQDKTGYPYENNLPVIQVLILVFAIGGSLLLAVMSFTITERKELSYTKTEVMGFKTSLKYTVKNKGFLIHVGLLFTITFFYSITYSQITFLVQDVLGISKDDPVSFLPIGVFLGASVAGFPIGMTMNRRVGGKRALMYELVIIIAGLIMLTFSFTLVLANISLLIVGLGFAGINLILPTLLADVIDKDELETGSRREGAYYGAAAFFTKPAQSLAAGIVALVLELTNYDQEATVQPLLAQFGILLTIGLIPAMFLICGYFLLRKFPIDGSTSEYKDMKRQIKALHDEKIARYREMQDQAI